MKEVMELSYRDIDDDTSHMSFISRYLLTGAILRFLVITTFISRYG